MQEKNSKKFIVQQPERTFAFFLVLYLPITWLFLGRGSLEETILVLYTGVMIGAALALIVKFVKYFAKAANEHKSEYGTMFVMYLMHLLMPLAAFKLFGYVSMRILPNHSKNAEVVYPELLCDLFRLIKDLYYNVFCFPHLINGLIVISLLAFTGMALLSVGFSRKQKTH